MLRKDLDTNNLAPRRETEQNNGELTLAKNNWKRQTPISSTELEKRCGQSTVVTHQYTLYFTRTRLPQNATHLVYDPFPDTRFESLSTEPDLKAISPPTSASPNIQFSKLDQIVRSFSKGVTDRRTLYAVTRVRTVQCLFPGMTPLHQAALDGNLSAVKLLVGNGADVNKQDEDTWTALHAACAEGHAEVCRYETTNNRFVSPRQTFPMFFPNKRFQSKLFPLL